ncbi:MAG: lytic transglycosylase domain-containing protein [Caulobacteraceae bacterium]|nr:lytic transglycosylase domain-containing protein [Caulobacteraceae bacterium]
MTLVDPTARAQSPSDQTAAPAAAASDGDSTAAAPAAPAIQYPGVAPQAGLSDTDRNALASAITAAKRGDGSGAQAAMALISDPAARKLALWVTVDIDGEQLSFMQLDQARRDLAGWPRSARRQQAAEKIIGASNLPPDQVIAWFGGAEPVCPQGAMALASAYQLAGKRPEAQALIRRWWRTRVFEVDAQRAMLSRFGDLLTPEDHVKRMDTLLYGQQGPAAREMLALMPVDQRALADARMALRAESSRATALVQAVPPALASDPGLAAERAAYLVKHGQEADALALVSQFPSDPPNDDAASRIWSTRRRLIGVALRAGDYRAAYAAATHTGLANGVDYTESQFYAGWLAFSKLRDPVAADQHFAEVQRAGLAPITQSRALYWRGRAAEAMGEDEVAKAFYGAGGRYYTTFYGQLSAEKAGLTDLVLGHDPLPTPADRARFEGRDLVRATKMLGDLGERDIFRTFVLQVDETLPNTQESALLVDLARLYGDQDLAMKVVRTAAQHGHILPERGYPVRTVPVSPEAPEAAMVFGITRQESGFDPRVHSGVGARGMMQLMPYTAQSVARRIGERFSPSMLDEPDYNMRLGAAYLGHMISNFGGSYVMAAAAYNAGPGRPADWSGYCGDPRTSSVDPVDFIECIPFSETRNYVMRVLEATQVYRARLNNGVTRFTLSADLKRGGYAYASASPASTEVASVGTQPTR